MPYLYGIQNRPGNRKVVVSVQDLQEFSDQLTYGDYGGRFNGHKWTRDPQVWDRNIARHAGADETYMHPSALVGVGSPLPVGSALREYGMNGFGGYTTVRADGQYGPAAVWQG